MMNGLIGNKRSYNASVKKFEKLHMAPETLGMEPFAISRAIVSHYNSTIKLEKNHAPYPVKKPQAIK